MAKKNNNLKPNKNHPQSPNQQNETSEASFVKQALSFSGPLPLPQILEQYNKINSTFAERIVVMAEKQAAHRQEQEKTGLIAEIECDKSRIKAEIARNIWGNDKYYQVLLLYDNQYNKAMSLFYYLEELLQVSGSRDYVEIEN